jgi:NAD(P)H-nitrite reductase large subunit
MHVIIIGNGIAGITAARHLRKQSDCRITVISKESDYFFSRTALMYVFMGHLKLEHTKPYEDWFWAKNKIELVRAEVQTIDFQEKKINFTNNSDIRYDKLIIATGSQPRWGHWSMPLAGVQGLYSVQDLELLEKNAKNTRHAVIVGGGLIGVELAEMLHSRQIAVTMLIREQGYWDHVLPAEESMMVAAHIQSRGIGLKFGTQLQAFVGQNHVEAVVTDKNEQIDCQLVGIAIGVQPNIDFLKNSPLEINQGILVDEFLATNQPDVYAIGDCAEHRKPPLGRRTIEQIWYTGRIMGETVAQTIANRPTAYRPGIFFNSAKFFDLEYQTYGHIAPKLNSDIDTFFWQHPTKEVCLRINYDNSSRSVIGFNVLGWRLRHEVCERWISQNKTLDFVIEHLKEANFDPEFFEQYHSLIAL